MLVVDIEASHWEYFLFYNRPRLARVSVSLILANSSDVDTSNRECVLQTAVSLDVWCNGTIAQKAGSTCMLTHWKDAPLIYFQFCRVDPRDWLEFNQRGKHFRSRGRSLKTCLNVLAMCEFSGSHLYSVVSRPRKITYRKQFFNSSIFTCQPRNDVNTAKYYLKVTQQSVYDLRLR